MKKYRPRSNANGPNYVRPLLGPRAAGGESIMRVSTVLFGALVATIAIVVTGCTVQATIKTKNRFVEENVTTESPTDWNGEDIVVNDQAVGASINGGLEIVADASATKVRAVARVLAMANADDKASADLSIAEAKTSFTVSGGAVACGHGGSHGSSNSGESGCEKLTVYVPIGTAAKKVNIKGLVGNGGMTMKVSSVNLGNLEGNSNGGDIDATVGTGTSVSLVSEKSDNIVLRLPDTFAADVIILNADQGNIINDFSDAKVGENAGGRGTAGSGYTSIKLTSKQFAGSSGKVTLTR